MVILPKGKYVFGSKWVYKTKYKLDDIIYKYKTRLVKKCYAEWEQIDHIEKFYPVEKLDKNKMVVSLVAQYKWTFY